MKNLLTLSLLAATAFAFTSCDKAASLASGADAIKNLGSAVTNITGAMGSITDKASAEGAVSKLETAGSTLESLVGKVDALPAPIKDQIKGKAEEFTAKFDALVEKVKAIPGVGGVIEGPVETIRGHLTALSS